MAAPALQKSQTGLVEFAPITELNKRPEDAFSKDKHMSNLAGHIHTVWEINKEHKETVRQEMLRDLRQRKGEYDPNIISQIKRQGGSEIFMMLTSTKCRAAASWLKDILMPATDKPWGLSPTPIPDLPEGMMQSIKEGFVQKLAERGVVPTRKQFNEMITAANGIVMEQVKETAKDAADAMELKMEDQMVEGGWVQAFSDFIEDFVTYPAAIMKGPVVRKRAALEWDEDFLPRKATKIVYEFERVSPFNIYPSPDATEIEDGDLIEHIRFTRSDIFNMKGMKGFKDDEIDEVLRVFGEEGLTDWVLTDSTHYDLEGKDMDESNMIDCLHYWGSAQGRTLKEWGISPMFIDDENKDYQIDAMLIGRHVIRAVLNDDPLGRRPYQKASYENIPGAFWGRSVPRLMKDVQRVANAAARALVNNLGIASGPQVEVSIDRLPDGEVITDIYPWKIWQTISDKMGNSNTQAVRFFQPDSNAASLLAVYERFERAADDVTNIPRFTHGNDKIGGAGRTASGLGMLMESAAKGMKHSINNIDEGIMTPCLEKLWFNNMVFDEDMSIKGDINIVVKGSSVMVAKDIAQQRRNELLQTTNNPTDMAIMGLDGRAKLLRDFIESADMPKDIVPDDKEIAEKIKAQSQQPDIDQLKLQQKGQQTAIDASLRSKERETDAQISREEMDSREAIAQDGNDVKLIVAAKKEVADNKLRKEKRKNSDS